MPDYGSVGALLILYSKSSKTKIKTNQHDKVSNKNMFIGRICIFIQQVCVWTMEKYT